MNCLDAVDEEFIKNATHKAQAYIEKKSMMIMMMTVSPYTRRGETARFFWQNRQHAL